MLPVIEQLPKNGWRALLRADSRSGGTVEHRGVEKRVGGMIPRINGLGGPVGEGKRESKQWVDWVWESEQERRRERGGKRSAGGKNSVSWRGWGPAALHAPA